MNTAMDDELPPKRNNISHERGANQKQPIILKMADHLVKLASEGFYGRVIVIFEAGIIRTIKQERTLKPDDLG